MLNINYGMNARLMNTCKPLEEYSWLVDAVRRHQKRTMNLEEAVEAAIEEMPDNFLIKKFLIANKVEVKGMFLTEWDQEKVLAQGMREAVNNDRKRVAMDMLKKNLPLSLIKEISKLSEETIRGLAKTIGVTIV